LSFHEGLTGTVKAKSLTLLSAPLLLKPRSPELNPIERVWHYLKQLLSWEIYQDIEQLQEQVRSIIEGFSPEIIASLTGWDYILETLATVA
jgi:transposase